MQNMFIAIVAAVLRLVFTRTATAQIALASSGERPSLGIALSKAEGALRMQLPDLGVLLEVPLANNWSARVDYGATSWEDDTLSLSIGRRRIVASGVRSIRPNAIGSVVRLYAGVGGGWYRYSVGPDSRHHTRLGVQGLAGFDLGELDDPRSITVEARITAVQAPSSLPILTHSLLSFAVAFGFRIK